MPKTSKKKSYTEDVVLNKILKEITEENLQNSNNTYEDDLIKHYRTKDDIEKKQKYINITKIIALLLIIIILAVMFISYSDSHSNKKIPIKKPVTPASLHPPKVEHLSVPVEVETLKVEQKENIQLKTEPKIIIPEAIKEAVQKVKTERELAKEKLLEQMKN